MKKLITILLCGLMLLVSGTSVFADDPDTKSAEVNYTESGSYEWSVPTSAITTTTSGVPGSVTVTKAILEEGKKLTIQVDGGKNYQTGTATGQGSTVGYNMALSDGQDGFVSGYFVSYSIAQASSGSNAGDTNKPATLKTGAIAKDDVLISVPAGQTIKTDGTLTTPVVEALTFTKTGTPAKAGTYKDTLTFTAAVVDAN